MEETKLGALLLMHYRELIVFSSILVIGLKKIFHDFLKIKKDYDFLFKYREKYAEFMDLYFTKNEWNGELYEFLIKKSDRAQDILGSDGIMGYKPPGGSSFITYTYNILKETIPQFRTQEVHPNIAQRLDDVLLMRTGMYEESLKGIKKKLLNPIIWFQQGIQTIISLPIILFYWLGILTTKKKNSIVTNKIFIFISNFFALLTFVSIVITIVNGYEQTIKFITNILSKS